MPSFKYTALDPSGAKQHGVLEGTSAAAVRNDLLARQFQAVNVRERKKWTQIEITRKKLRPEDVMNFTRQLSAFLRAGIPILDALDTLQRDTQNPLMRQTTVDIADALRGGSTFADAVGAHSEIFPSYYVGILRSAELTGHVDVVLDQLAAYIERDLATRRAVRTALTYPAAIAVMAAITIGVLAIYVLPKFEGFFEDYDAELPLVTRMLLDLSRFIGDWWPVIAGGILLVVIAIGLYFRTARGRVTRDRLLLRLPVVGDIVRDSAVERFCRILGTMLRAGVPIPEAMASAIEATNNRVFQIALTDAREDVLRGEGIGDPVVATGLFPESAGQMIKVGEHSGTLDTQLVLAADFFEDELQHKLTRFTSLFEPAVIIVMGLIVGFVAIALVSAMYGLLDNVSAQQ